MTTVLGIGNPDHDTGAALLENGTVVCAVNESRLSRVKRESRFPISAINYVAEEMENTPDRIAISGIKSPFVIRNIRYGFRHSEGAAGYLDTLASTAYKGLKQKRGGLLGNAIKELSDISQLGLEISGIRNRIEYVDHHYAHAASAYYTCPFDQTTVLTVDAAGDGYSATVYTGVGGDLSRIAATDDVDSIGKLWAQVPTVFGFKGAKHAGKFMGMASYGEDTPEELESLFREMIRVDGLTLRNGFERQYHDENYESHIRGLKELLGGFKPSQVAGALQKRTEEVLKEYAENAVEETGFSNVTVAGGVFANVKVNQRIYESPKTEKLFVHQNMGDGGLGLGAALAVYADDNPDFEPSYLDNVYLGPEYNEQSIERALERVDIPEDYTVERFESEAEAADTVADFLAGGNVVSLYTGRVEYGPRALGNRSILYQPTDPSAIEWLNDRLDRTEFMPFAPVTLKERADECYINYDSERCPAADFMTISLDCTEDMQERSPGVVHVDGTARPQLIDEETNPLYYAILEAYEKRTGIPSLINTSFNMHGEPIVCNPTEAVRSFLNTGNEALLMQQALLRKGAE